MGCCNRCADGRRATISIGTVAIAAVVTVTTAICITAVITVATAICVTTVITAVVAVIAAVVAAIVDLVELP